METEFQAANRSIIYAAERAYYQMTPVRVLDITDPVEYLLTKRIYTSIEGDLSAIIISENDDEILMAAKHLRYIIEKYYDVINALWPELYPSTNDVCLQILLDIPSPIK